MLQQRARRFAETLGIENFQASDGLLSSFKSRHNIAFKVISGEAASVDEEVLRGWINNLKVITEGHTIENILNADETGLF
jgi:hypothetical protein